MIDERELEQYFARQTKPELRPLLDKRVLATARSRPAHGLSARLHLIWTAVLLACFVACSQVRLHLPGIVICAIAVLSTLVLTGTRRAALMLLLTGQNKRHG